jgi:uncharacterized protein YecE (DUF72 family)
MQWHIGCSGFHYKEWKEVFYPKDLPAAKWFEYYCRQFNTIEINNTFYRFPDLRNLQGWFQKSPSSFVFSIKVPQIITHQRKFRDTKDLLYNFYDVLSAGLGEKLGPVLFQLPPQLHFSSETLNDMLNQLDDSFMNVVEFRHISWWRKEVVAALGSHKAVFCSVSYPGLINEVVTAMPFCYYRFHGVPKLYHSSYTESFLQDVVQQITAHKDAEKAFLYFNNTASAAAIGNAKAVEQMVKDNSGQI